VRNGVAHQYRYGQGVYTLTRTVNTASNTKVAVHTRNGKIDSDTIYEFVDTPVPLSGGGMYAKYLMNRVSTVKIGRVQCSFLKNISLCTLMLLSDSVRFALA
jgi:hypothetical protein